MRKKYLMERENGCFSDGGGHSIYRKKTGLKKNSYEV